MNKSQGTAPIQWQRIFEVFAYVRNIRSQVSRGVALEELTANAYSIHQELTNAKEQQ